MSQIGRATEELSEISRACMPIPYCCLLGMMAFYCIEQTSWLKLLPGSRNHHKKRACIDEARSPAWQTGQNGHGDLAARISKVRGAMIPHGTKVVEGTG